MYLRRVKELREDSDTPQKVIAEYLGVKQNTYSDYENGKIKIPLEVFSEHLHRPNSPIVKSL